MQTIKKSLSWLTGRYYENRVLAFLKQQGLTFVERNARNRAGEIDLIMRNETGWIFVEVRYRKNCDYGDALLSVNWHKRRKLLAATKYWLAQRQESFETSACRFDICAITGNQFEWIQNAFNDSNHS
ncbi:MULTISPECIES: YraN family protein [unclassified Providencia]|uniref:YraN family protein n=1 Tax=unclassified Providencia TaxID=2633465 RepID=UPI000E8E268A|nr:YraN family protein [Providencia sp.]MBP6080190.1 YraN family protein [Providencia sp.]HBO23105.1 YraN family protein [Providencia sp.]